MTEEQEKRARYLSYLEAEREAEALYQAMAQAEEDPKRAQVFRELAESERRHALYWTGVLGMSAEDLPPFHPRFRARLLRWMAEQMGTQRVLSLLLRRESNHSMVYGNEQGTADIRVEEERHAHMLRELREGRYLGSELREEGWRRAAARGIFRAGIMGGNDGLVSIFALVWGVAGGTSNQHIVLLAGLAGLIAGAISMGAGEYISMRVDRDIAEHRLALERSELERFPDAEREELLLIYQLKGLTRDEAEVLADRIMADTEVAFETMAREELGLDPGRLQSPWGAAVFSFSAFTAGGAVPVLPYVFARSDLAFAISGGASTLALLVTGALLAFLSGKAPLWGGIRMLAIGVGAALVTLGVGSLVGVSVS